MFSEKLYALVISCMILGATVSAASSDGENRESSYGDYAVTALKLTAPVAMGAGAIYAAPLALAYVGFTTGGVAATSAAAAAQGYVYGAWTTGVFSALQSAGAVGGFSAVGNTAIFVSTAGSVAAVEVVATERKPGC